MSHFVDRQVDVEREADSHIKMETWLFWQSVLASVQSDSYTWISLIVAVDDC